MGRYSLSKDLDDLKQSIPHFTEAILLPLPWDRRCLNIIQIFFNITLFLVHRANESRQPEDVTRSIIHLHYLRGKSLEAFNVPPDSVAIYLVTLLGIKAEMKLGDARQDIEEMAVLCHEHLRSDISTTSLTGCLITELIRSIYGNARSRMLNERQEPSDKVIECLREAKVRLPDSYEVSIALVLSLFDRFCIAYSNNDYEEGMSILGEVTPTAGDRPTQLQEVALMLKSPLVATFALVRYYMSGKPEYLEHAIHHFHAGLGETSLEAEPLFVYWLARLRRSRFDDFGVASGIEAHHRLLRNSGVSNRPSFQDLTASLTELNADNQRIHLQAIISLEGITDGAEIEEAIKYCRLLLASTHQGSVFAYEAGIALGILLYRAFLCTYNIEYLNEAISVERDNFNIQGVQQADFFVIQRLINSLLFRFKLLRCREDIDEIMQLYLMAVGDERASTPDRFVVSCDWAYHARTFAHPSTSPAYDRAISLMQDTVTFSPTLDIQHHRLVAMRDRYENLSLDYASYHVSTGQLPQAIETLDQGRALIWSEMRGLRASIGQIRARDSRLADKFAAVNRDLEMLTLTISADINDDNRLRDGSSVRMDPYGRRVLQQRKLLDDRNKLISQIQTLPGFENFLKSPSFDDLQSAAARGPVIIVIHCRWRSDIIILHHNSPPSHIPTADDFYARAINMRDHLFGARKEGLESNQYEDALSYVLKELYELVGRPVIQRLTELRVPEQSRVWWCPTSVFCSLPLHAIGPIPSDGGSPLYFLDLYITSYTPTLSTLIASNDPGPHTLEKPSILLVSQPDASLPEALRETQVVQATSTRVTTLISAMATPATVLEHLRDHRFAHIVCHGRLEPGNPFDASFKLHRDKRLSLLDIVRSRLPKAEFAFLSACHTAELTEGGIADEALHLTAAVQYCGFRSVVGTMWEMADTDGPDLAGKFYKRVFSSRSQGVRYYERTAEALRDAVKILRGRKRMTLDRWVNFVHYGA
jgi:CHAT domain-containing protein